MMKYLEGQLKIIINEQVIIDEIKFYITKLNSVVILGESGTGKTLILKKIKELDGIKLSGSMDFYFKEKSNNKEWMNELKYDLQPKVIQKFLNLFFKNNKNIEYKIELLKKVFLRPDFLILEDLQEILNYDEKKLLFALLKEIEVTCLYVTKDVEDIVFFKYVIVLKNGKVALEGNVKSVVKEEKIMKVLGYSIPFYVNMSIQLELYGLMKGIAYNKEELERLLWMH